MRAAGCTSTIAARWLLGWTLMFGALIRAAERWRGLAGVEVMSDGLSDEEGIGRAHLLLAKRKGTVRIAPASFSGNRCALRRLMQMSRGRHHP